jgi:hypothetical protein
MKSNLDQIHLKSVSKLDYDFLYDLLKQRKPEVNISHKKMPTMKQHEKFVSSKPYKKWYVIKLLNEPIGSIYLSFQNEIGFFLKKEYDKNILCNYILNLFIKKNPQSEYFVNINPKNKRSSRFFQNYGFTLLQKTYKL